MSHNMRLMLGLLLCFPQFGGEISQGYEGLVMNRREVSSNGMFLTLCNTEIVYSISLSLSLSIAIGAWILFCVAVFSSHKMRTAKYHRTSQRPVQVVKSSCQLKLESELVRLQSRIAEVEHENHQLLQRCDYIAIENKQLKNKCEHTKRQNTLLASKQKKLEDCIKSTRKASEMREKSVVITIDPTHSKAPKSRRVTFAPQMVLEDVCYFDQWNLFKDDVPVSSKPRMCV